MGYRLSHILKKAPISIIGMMLIIYSTIALFPIKYRLLWQHIDESHKVAVNYFMYKNIIFGRDVLFSYGPLGFFMTPMDIGCNLYIAKVFNFTLWAIFFGFIGYFTSKRVFSVMQLGLFFCFFYAGRLICPSADYFVSFLTILLLSGAVVSKRWYIFYTIALLLSVLSLFIKFGSAFISIAAIAAFILLTVCTDRKKILNLISVTIIIFSMLILVLYYYFNVTLADMAAYIKGICEISSGYNIAVSLEGEGIALAAAFLVFICYGFLVFALYRFKQASFHISLILMPPLFVTFKHGFIRPDLHVFWFFGFTLLAFAVILLFTDLTKIVKSKIAIRTIKQGILLGIIAMIGLAAYRDIKYEKNVILQPRVTQGTYLRELLNKVGTHSFSAFPFDISSDIYDVSGEDRNYRPFRVLHMYSAYTSYLDLLNADYLESREKAPEFIIMSWRLIDRRHPLADVPATWLSIYRWYKVRDQKGSLLLLERRSSPLFKQPEFMERREYKSGDLVEVPVSDNPVIAKIYMKLNTLGRIYKVMFKIPEIKMKLYANPSSVFIFRIIPDTIKDGLLINYLPMQLNQIDILLNENKAKYKIGKFMLYGEGMRFYSDKITVEFYKIPDVRIE